MPFLAISLLTILAGTLLLAKFKKDTPGKFFTFISWFFIVAGFLLFIGFLAGGICKIKHHGFGRDRNCQHERMMQDCNHGGMQGGFCCPKGMHQGVCSGKPACMPNDSAMKCCPKGMGQGMFSGKPMGMSHDSTMKCCPKGTASECAKMPVQKK